MPAISLCSLPLAPGQPTIDRLLSTQPFSSSGATTIPPPDQYASVIHDDALRELYDRADDGLSLAAEIRLVRAYIASAAGEGRQKDVESACASLVRLVRAQTANRGPDSLAQMLDEVGEEILKAEETRDGNVNQRNEPNFS